MRTKSFAIFAARYFQRDRQQDLLADYVVQQNSLPFIIADLGLGVGHRHFVPPSIRALRTIEQIKLALHILRERFQAARAVRLQTGRKPAPNAYILNDLVLAVMFFDQIRPPAALDRCDLPVIRTQVNGTRLKLLRKLYRMKFQVFDFEEHRKPPRTSQASSSRKHA